MLSNATNQPKSTVELGYMCPRGLLGPPAVTTHQVVEIQKETSTEMYTPFSIGLNLIWTICAFRVMNPRQ